MELVHGKEKWGCSTSQLSRLPQMGNLMGGRDLAPYLAVRLVAGPSSW